VATEDKKQMDQAEQKTQQQTPGEKRVQKRQVRFVEEGVKTLYSGVFNIGFGNEEVVFIFGNQAVDPNTIRIESKIAVSLKTAKRMAVTLSDLIRRYESRNGVIDINVSRAAVDEEKKNH
jgi:hypothetical protein